jgi:hypothetical protein
LKARGRPRWRFSVVYMRAILADLTLDAMKKFFNNHFNGFSGKRKVL